MKLRIRNKIILSTAIVIISALIISGFVQYNYFFYCSKRRVDREG